MDWPDILELTLDNIAQGGEGVGRWQERVVFASGGLPGERVCVQLHERHDTYARGVVTDILEESPDRVLPRIPGATYMAWQQIAYPAQLRFKRQILHDQLAKIANLTNITVKETIPASRPWEYRNNARFHVEGDRIGYYDVGSRDLLPIEVDPLLLPVLNDALVALRAVLHPRDGVAEVMLRASESYGYVVVELRGSNDPSERSRQSLYSLARRWRNRCPALAGVVFPNAPAQGADYIVEELDDIVFTLHPSTFFQVNRAAATVLLQQVRAGLDLQGNERLLDLYCGAGAFALPLASQAAEVVGVEEHAGAVNDAQSSAADNGITNARFIVGQVERVLAQLDEQFDAVVLDPPRRGCHPQTLEALARFMPSRIVYVSCQPATLARDLKRLVAGGYRVVSAQPVDLFPQTAHIESVCVLVRDGEL